MKTRETLHVPRTSDRRFKEAGRFGAAHFQKGSDLGPILDKRPLWGEIFEDNGRRQAQGAATDFARVRVGIHRMLPTKENANVVTLQALAAHTRLSTEPNAS